MKIVTLTMNPAVDKSNSGQQFRFGMPGPELSRDEWQACLDRILEQDTTPEFIITSGSLPPGVPDDFYGTVARRCREKTDIRRREGLSRRDR